jgi:hypothetical protein
VCEVEHCEALEMRVPIAPFIQQFRIVFEAV